MSWDSHFLRFRAHDQTMQFGNPKFQKTVFIRKAVTAKNLCFSENAFWTETNIAKHEQTKSGTRESVVF